VWRAARFVETADGGAARCVAHQGGILFRFAVRKNDCRAQLPLLGLVRYHTCQAWCDLKFGELVRLLERNGFTLVREKGSIRYYSKPGVDRLIRIDFHGAKEVPKGTCNAILKAAGLKPARSDDQ
jgi:predicted RNA binding protein YcfA (HicA-like mRNA interferase family)